MRLLRTISDKDIFPGYSSSQPIEWRLRRAARAVAEDSDGKVALLFVAKYSYHKLPGGGVEKGEDMLKALEREFLEEVGGEIEILGELGQITEYKAQMNEKQESFCYLARLKGDQADPQYTEEEMSDGFRVRWANSLEEAIKILQSDSPSNYEGNFIQARDLTFLKEAQLRRE